MPEACRTWNRVSRAYLSYEYYRCQIFQGTWENFETLCTFSYFFSVKLEITNFNIKKHTLKRQIFLTFLIISMWRNVMTIPNVLTFTRNYSKWISTLSSMLLCYTVYPSLLVSSSRARAFCRNHSVTLSLKHFVSQTDWIHQLGYVGTRREDKSRYNAIVWISWASIFGHLRSYAAPFVKRSEVRHHTEAWWRGGVVKLSLSTSITCRNLKIG